MSGFRRAGSKPASQQQKQLVQQRRQWKQQAMNALNIRQRYLEQKIAENNRALKALNVFEQRKKKLQTAYKHAQLAEWASYNDAAKELDKLIGLVQQLSQPIPGLRPRQKALIAQFFAKQKLNLTQARQKVTAKQQQLGPLADLPTEALGHWRINSVFVSEKLFLIQKEAGDSEALKYWARVYAYHKGKPMPDPKNQALDKDFLREKFGANVIERIASSDDHLVIEGTFLLKLQAYKGKQYKDRILLFDSRTPEKWLSIASVKLGSSPWAFEKPELNKMLFGGKPGDFPNPAFEQKDIHIGGLERDKSPNHKPGKHIAGRYKIKSTGVIDANIGKEEEEIVRSIIKNGLSAYKGAYLEKKEGIIVKYILVLPVKNHDNETYYLDVHLDYEIYDKIQSISP